MDESSTSSLSSAMERNAKQATVEKIRQDRNGAPDDVERLLEVIEQHLFEPTFDVRALRPSNARAAETTWRFRDWLGSDPPAYIDRLRLETACHLVENSDASMADIATCLGFNTAGAFRKWFKRRRGQSFLAVRGGRLVRGSERQVRVKKEDAERPLDAGHLLASAAEGTTVDVLVRDLPCLGRQALLGALSPADTTLVRFFVKWRSGMGEEI